MKIGFLINYFYPFLGGAESNCFYLARELVKKGHEVHVFTTNQKGKQKLKKEETIKGIKVHRSKVWFRYRYYFTFAPGLLSNVFKYNLEILHVHSFGFLYHDFIVLLKKLFSKTKLINTPHGPFMSLPSYNLPQIIIKKTVELIENLFNHLYDTIIEVNPYQKMWLKEKGAKKVDFVPNGITKDVFSKVQPTNKYKDKFIISYIGRIQKYKGLDQVIKVLPKLNEDVIFMAIGEDAGDKERLIKLSEELRVSNRVFFTGKIKEQEKLSLLDASKVFILPSEWEAFGIVILEAMARGKVIISTKTEGGRYLIKKENGFLYPNNNLKQLEEILKTLTKVDLKKYEALNIKKAREFDWSNIVSILEEAYKNSKRH